MSTFCPNCGSELTENSKFCTSCGSAVNSVSNDDVVETPVVLEEDVEVIKPDPIPSYSQETVNETPVQPTPVQSSYSNADSVNTSAPNGESKVLAIVSLVLGILSLLCCCWFGFVGIIISLAGAVCGIISLATHKGGKGLAIAGIICSGLGLILAGIMTSLAASLASLSESDIMDMINSLNL